MEVEPPQTLFASEMDDTMSPFESLSLELFSHILSFIDPHDQQTLNSLSQTSSTLYHLTIPVLYHSFSYRGMQHDIQHLRRFLDTLNWRPDLAVHVRELDLREWGNCPKLEDYVGVMDEEYYEMKEKDKAKKKRESEMGTILDDELLGDDGDVADVEEEAYVDETGEDETYVDQTDEDEKSDWSEDSEDEIDGDEDEIPSEELEFLGPILPYNHDDCVKGDCNNSIGKSLKREGRKLGFEREDILYYSWKIWHEAIWRDESDEEYKELSENELIILLLSWCQNIQTMCMVMPEVYFERAYEKNPLCMFLENTSLLATSRVLQKLETLYICSPMHPGGKDHRQYELDIRRLFPLMRLPNLKSLYTLTVWLFWDRSETPQVDYTPHIHTSNIETLFYDECTLCPYDVSRSLSIFHGLKSFRWTTSASCFAMGDTFVAFQSEFGEALKAHRDTLKELYFDHRHPQVYKNDWSVRAEPKTILIGSLNDYPKLKKLAIDETSLIGHQNWISSSLPLEDILPPNLESLTLFTKINQEQPNDEIIFENRFFYPSFLSLLHHIRTQDKLPKLRKISIQLKRDIVIHWGQDPPKDIIVNEAQFEEARLICKEKGIELEVGIAIPWDEDEIREVGNTEISYFMEQIRGRNPGRDY